MADLLDYIEWRGDLTPQEKAYGEVDYALLSVLTYLDLADVYEHQPIAYRDLLAKIKEQGEPELKIVSEHKAAHPVLDSAAASERFGNVMIEDVLDLFDEEDDMQFTAMTWKVSDTDVCVVFRGTDDSVAGWKEDFIASYRQTHGQQMAKLYLQKAILKYGKVTAAGHSKGGNLALYAAVNLPKEQRECIKHLYLFDSPGLCESMSKPEVMKELDSRITFITPDDCTVGRIFELQVSDHRIIESDGFTVLAHDMCTWQMQGPHFKQAEGYTRTSEMFADKIQQWLTDIPEEERERVVENAFDRIERLGVRSLRELKEHISPVNAANHLVHSAREKTGKILHGRNSEESKEEDLTLTEA